MRVSTYEPQAEVRLYKTVKRGKVHDRAAAAQRYRIPYFNLTEYLGEGGGIRVSKGVREPYGSFTLTFPDRPIKAVGDQNVLESIYGLVEPMDLVEIRFARNPQDYANSSDGHRLPIVMRGWVTDVDREEGIGQDGRPLRRVVIAGQDFGKILQILRIYYVANAATGDNIIHGFKLLQKYNIDFDKMMPIAEFIAAIGQKIVDPWLQNLLACSSSIAQEWLSVQLDVTAIGKVNYQYVNNFEGPLYNLLAQVCDVSAGFKELFVEDRESGVFLVCRQTPWYEPDGTPVNINTPEKMDTVSVLDSDIVSLRSGRSDANVANAFWVRNPAWNLLNDQSLRLTNNYGVAENGLNNSPAHYGLRLLDAELRTGSPDGFVSDRLSESKQNIGWGIEQQWQLAHLDLLRTLHKDEVVFERGVMRLKGNEKIRAGRFIKTWRGSNTNLPPWVAYVDHVDHEFIPYQGFFTTLRFERGTGFVERAKLDNSPYLSEISPEGFV